MFPLEITPIVRDKFPKLFIESILSLHGIPLETLTSVAIVSLYPTMKGGKDFRNFDNREGESKLGHDGKFSGVGIP